jgi:methyl-accepting chemotaxis protein
MTVGKKLYLVGGLLVGLTILLGATSLFGLQRYKTGVRGLSENALPGVMVSSKVQAEVLEMRGDMWRHVAATDPADIAKMDSEIQRLKGEIAAGLKDLDATADTPTEREIFQKIGPAIERFYQVWENVAALSRSNKNEDAYRMLGADGTPPLTIARTALEDEAEYNRQLGTKGAAEIAGTGARATWLIWLMLLTAVGAGSAGLFFVVSGLNRELRRTVSELREGAMQVSTASSHVASASHGLAQGASEQAASLEETSASSEEITSMTRRNAENSAQAATLMADVDHRVTEGNHTLEDMVVSMREITGSSGKISKIIKVIDEIAFQTNILALNAAVEAARAGEAGMGFAVVADEVRNLAQRSAQAAKDTSELIEESISRSHAGGTKLERVSEVIHAITESTAKVKTLVDEVNLGSQEQARGIEQISKAIAQMDHVTQSTAAQAEESASASEELSAQAAATNQVVMRLSALVNGGSQDSEVRAAEVPAYAGVPAPRQTKATIARNDFPLDEDSSEG